MKPISVVGYQDFSLFLGMAVFTRYAMVVDAPGKALSVREALALINQTLDEALSEQEGDFDADSRWALARQLGEKAEPAWELCYRLYTLCERKKRAAEALSYNGLAQSWPEIMRLAQEGGKAWVRSGELFGDGEE